MTTIQSIKFSITELKHEIIRRTPAISLILKALDNLEKKVDEYEYLTDKLFRQQIELQYKEIYRLTVLNEELRKETKKGFEVEWQKYAPSFSTMDVPREIEWIGVDMEAKKS